MDKVPSLYSPVEGGPNSGDCFSSVFLCVAASFSIDVYLYVVSFYPLHFGSVWQSVLPFKHNASLKL